MSHKPKALRTAIDKIREHMQLPELKEFADQIRNGDRRALSMAFSFLESSKEEYYHYGLQVLSMHAPNSVNSQRIGITGVPGVGKSTLIEMLGLHYINEGHRVAVLAVDPSSPVSGGSILGDKTRMQQLSMHSSAFIRPTAAAKALGGVASDTKLAIQLCEMAGYDRILVETVGVGQSEVAVHGMTDMFVLLMLAGAGDQLQGIKRGIIELCDAMVITKSDGDNLTAANYAKAEYTGALHLIAPKASGWVPEIVTASSLSSSGMIEVISLLARFMKFTTERGLQEENRRSQDTIWLKNQMRDLAYKRFFNSSSSFAYEDSIEKALKYSEPIAKVLLEVMSKQ